MNPVPKSHAVLITVGIVALVVGQVIYDGGRQQAIESSISLYSSNDGGGAIIVGGIVSLYGLVSLVIGVYRLATAVEYLTRREHARAIVAEMSDDEG